MRAFEGWFLNMAVSVECPNCGQTIGPDSDLAELLERASEHEQSCGGIEP